MSNQENTNIVDSNDSESVEIAERIEHQLIEQPELIDMLLDSPKIMAVVQHKVSHFQGPLPPPSMFREYENILPGTAERLLSLSEKEQAFRHDTKSKAIQGVINKDKRGQWMGFTISVMILVIATIFAALGNTWFAGTLITLDLVGLAAVFVAGRAFKSDS
ncbi:DUF2335 domain-containing protein [Photorhabdus bodei]|nr:MULTISPECIES: DUF2335 domain-containing protein [Photorhabdus]MCC8375777.1 DUF2335 domain-containing protein [Photorhabdus bodei]